MAEAFDVGILGEKIARRFLRRHGYRILESNIHQSHKEIDIIATNKEYIVFVEVKTRSVENDPSELYERAASAVNKRKQQNLIFAARSYLSQHYTDKQPRMDVLEVYVKKGTKKVVEINHITNAYLS